MTQRLIVLLTLMCSNLTFAESIADLIASASSRAASISRERANQIDSYVDPNAEYNRQEDARVARLNQEDEDRLTMQHYQEDLVRNAGRMNFIPPPPRLGRGYVAPPAPYRQHPAPYDPQPDYIQMSARRTKAQPAVVTTSNDPLTYVHVYRTDDKSPCGAAAITKHAVVTAAHCLDPNGRLSLRGSGEVSAFTITPDSSLPKRARDFAVAYFTNASFEPSIVGKAEVGQTVNNLLSRGSMILDALTISYFTTYSGQTTNTHYITNGNKQENHDSGSPIYTQSGELVGVLNGCTEDMKQCGFYGLMSDTGKGVLDELSKRLTSGERISYR